MSKNDLELASVSDFFYWINERHRIYVNRFVHKKDKPWTEDKIFREYKFTNVFRQLDSGTIALNKMLDRWHNNPTPLHDMDVEDAIDILFNIVWYRLFNLEAHAEDIGFQSYKDHRFILDVLLKKRELGQKVFTSAHMTSGSGAGMMHGKVYAHMVGPVGIAEEFGERYISYIFHHQTMREVTKLLQNIPMVGPFIAYEIACDLRFTPLLSGATDKLLWANLGPGAKRGLLRLDMEPSVQSMRDLYDLAIREGLIELHVAEHLPFNNGDPPFELREIEHSLCEFDKYMRVKTGAGRPRQKYNGEKDNDI